MNCWHDNERSPRSAEFCSPKSCGRQNTAATPLFGRLIPLIGEKIPLFGSVAEFRSNAN
jgi:hypothetical protein